MAGDCDSWIDDRPAGVPHRFPNKAETVNHMNFRALLGCSVALAMFATSTVEGIAFAGGPGAFAGPGIARDPGLSEDIVLARAGARRNVNVNRGANVNVRRGANVNVRRGPNVNVQRGPTVVVRRPVRVWSPRPYYGTIVAGVALGTVIAATVAATAPRPPASNLCWFWSDAAQAWGYWDYCSPPR